MTWISLARVCRSALDNYFNFTPSPAPGFRDAGDNGRLGALMSVGYGGYSWSSAVSGTDGVFLGFGPQHLGPSGAHGLGHGLLLRCLSE